MKVSRLQSLSHPRLGPLLETEIYTDTKDPCPVFDGKKWHLYGTFGNSKTGVFGIFHTSADLPEGPWKDLMEIHTVGISGKGIAAPSVEYDEKEKNFHMFVQTDYKEIGSSIEHLVSKDGTDFHYADTALHSLPFSPEAGIYDPHAAVINGEKFLTYSGFARVSRPDIYLAKSMSGTWNGPWERRGRILSHYEITHHNQPDHPDYEWGLEGSQLIELPNGLVLMNAVCFLPEGIRGTRQRVFFTIARQPEGPYSTLGPVLNPENNEWESGENGHASGRIMDDKLILFYQARAKEEGRTGWKLGLVKYHSKPLEEISERILNAQEKHNSIELWALQN